MFRPHHRFLVLIAATSFITHLAYASSLEEGIALYQRENFDEAEQALQKAREEEPSSTRAAYYLGVTAKRLQKYKEARQHLSDAVSGTPKIKEALPELIEVLYQLNDAAEAEKWIGVAEQENVRPAQTAFLKGLVLMRQDKPTEAIESFKKAKELDVSMQQAADYQIGMAHLRQESFSEAAEAFKEVLVLDPNTDIGAYANEYVKALERRRDADRPWKLNVGVYGEWDDNVVLKPSDSTTVQDIGSEDDFREVVTLSAEYNHRWNEGFGTKLSYDLYFANQEDLDQFDVHSHTFGVTPSWYAKQFTFSLPILYNYTWVDNDDFLGTVTVNPTVNVRAGTSQVFQGSVKLQDKNFFRTPVLADEDRDAFRVAPGVAWYWFFMDNQGFLGGRYEYDYEDTDGRNWEYSGHRGNVSFQWPFTAELKGTVSAEYYAQDFENTHSIFNTKREDDSTTLSALLSYSFTKQLELQFRYTYVNHDSNLSLYEYDRNVYSTGVAYRF